MNLIFKVTAISALTLVFSLLLKQSKPEYSFVVSVCGGLVALLCILNSALGYFSVIKGYLSDAGIDSQAVGMVIKAVGIGYITEFSAATARDFSQTSLALKIVLAGKLAVLFIALPLIKQLIELALSFLS